MALDHMNQTARVTVEKDLETYMRLQGTEPESSKTHGNYFSIP